MLSQFKNTFVCDESAGPAQPQHGTPSSPSVSPNGIPPAPAGRPSTIRCLRGIPVYGHGGVEASDKTSI
ncbi:hypothetical protein Micbo1qcDRAFT_163151 [Microdochium bolleyi]|uniref:Uncharacterized protein n=1 Tax=Microdochium bolleyi TaxID=196109 RepID=A0A136J2V5_9PEZI|nr:hypothetical protein Micbo1qcDRAFT_163151 [Microdochium bolleyi]